MLSKKLLKPKSATTILNLTKQALHRSKDEKSENKKVQVLIWKSRKTLHLTTKNIAKDKRNDPELSPVIEIPTLTALAILANKYHNFLIPSKFLEMFCGHVAIKTTNHYVSFWPTERPVINDDNPQVAEEIVPRRQGEFHTEEKDIELQGTSPHYQFVFEHLNVHAIEGAVENLKANEKFLCWEMIPEEEGMHNCCSITALLLEIGGMTPYPSRHAFLTPRSIKMHCEAETAKMKLSREDILLFDKDL